jgi:hypothetical protein
MKPFPAGPLSILWSDLQPVSCLMAVSIAAESAMLHLRWAEHDGRFGIWLTPVWKLEILPPKIGPLTGEKQT